MARRVASLSPRNPAACSHASAGGCGPAHSSSSSSIVVSARRDLDALALLVEAGGVAVFVTGLAQRWLTARGQGKSVAGGERLDSVPS